MANGLTNELIATMQGTPDQRLARMENEMKHLATKLDLKQGLSELRDELKGGIANLRDELKGDTTNLRNELKGDIANLRNELKGDIANLQTNFSNLENRLGRMETKVNLLLLLLPLMLAVFKYG